MKEIKKITENLISQRIVLAVIVIFVFLAGLVTVLGRYYQAVADADYQIAQGLRQQEQEQTVDLAELEADYRSNYRRIIGDYLARFNQAGAVVNDDFLSSTKQAKQSLLDLKVTAGLKDTHLATVLLFTNLEAAISEEDQVSVSEDMSKMEQLLQNFPAD